MFGQMTSLTGGGGLSSSSTASADGDNAFSNAFNYKNGAQASNNNMLIIAAITIAALYFASKK